MSTENKYDHLQELGGSDYKIVEGEPNIKGWTVKTNTGMEIGTVDELLFEPQTRKVRYIIVDLNGKKLAIADDKKVLVPIGVARIYDDGKKQDEVVAPNDPNADSVVIGNDPDMNAVGYNPYDDGKVVIVPATMEQLIWLPEYKEGYVTPQTEMHVRQIFEGSGREVLVVSDTDNIFNKDDFYNHGHFNDSRFNNNIQPH